MAKVLIPVPNANSMDLDGDGKVTVDELVRSALLIFAALVVLLGAMIVGGWLLVAAKFPPWRAMGVIPLLAAVLTAVLLLWRMTRYERQEREAKRDLEFERERKQWEFDQARGISQEAGATTLAQAEIDAAALQILTRYYDGRGWSRDACEKDNVMSAELWNEANAMLKKRRIRKGRGNKLEPDDFDAAWKLYCEQKLKANQHRIANGNWTEAA